MCRPTPTTIQKNTEPSPPNAHQYKFWPLHPLAVLALFPLLPTYFYLNRGYTQWFHWTATAYLLTGSAFLRRFLVVQGAGITVGWYAAICNDLYLNGRFCQVLYKNMPTTMTDYMVDSQTGSLVTDNWQSLTVMALSHLLDTLGHPILTFVFWRLHCRAGGSLKDLFSWNVVVSTYMLSRLWSLTHTLYNFGTPGLFYFGYDVYIIDDLDSWIAAYVAEGVVYAGIVVYKIFWEKPATVSTTTVSALALAAAASKKAGLVGVIVDTKPTLIPSDSGVSTESI
jgi:hypothetical protein